MVYTVIGKNSFLASELSKNPQTKNWVFLTHRQAVENTSWAENSTCVMNFAFSPKMMKEGYSVQEDIDSVLAQKISEKQACRYILISSRKVYGSSAQAKGYKEDDLLAPDTPYGAAKMRVEQSVSEILPPDRLIIIRPSNIFGREFHRKTFFGYALTRLVNEGRIVYDFNPAVVRDFLSVEKFTQDLVTIAGNFKGGIYNLGAGFGVPCGDIAEWLIEGYGKGVLEVSDMTEKDAFWLDMSRTQATFGLKPYQLSELTVDCKSVFL